MKKVAIVNGAARQFKYNQFLATKYEDLGFQTKEYKFNPFLMFSCHLHKRLQKTVEEIVNQHDVIHCQSGGYFPIIHHYCENQIKKPFIFETPVLRSTTGTLFAGINLAKTYEVDDNRVIQAFLDACCFTPKWVNKTMKAVLDLKERNQSLMLMSKEDMIADNRECDHFYHHIFEKGKHGRLFYDNDFKVIQEYLEKFPQLHQSQH
jgi:predicted esterase YcpF (UPF0227 family)